MPNLIVISGEEEFLMERAARDEASLSLSEEVLEFTSDELENYKIEAGSAVIGGQKRTLLYGMRKRSRLCRRWITTHL